MSRLFKELFALTLLTGMPIPLLPVQLLWLNLLTDGAPEPEVTFYPLYNAERVEV